MGRYIDRRALVQNLLVLFGVIAAMKLTGGSGFLIVIPLAFVALTQNKPTKLFFYLMVTIAVLIGNNWVMPKNMVFALAQRGMMVGLGLILASQLAGAKKDKIVTTVLLILPYSFYAIIPSVAGWCPVISGLKLFLFLTMFLAMYGVSNRMANDARSTEMTVRSMLLSFSILFVVGSVLLIPFPAISQITGEEYEEMLKSGAVVTSLFKGMTGHSQCLGPMMALLFTILLGDLVFSIQKPLKLYILLLLLCPFLIYKTSSRTAMGGLMVGAMTVIWLAMKARGVSERWRGKVVSASLMVVAVLSAAICVVPEMRNGALSYMLKYSTATSSQDVSVESMVMTRRGKWDDGIENFKESPMIGNGFQVSADMEGFQVNGIRSILSAPIEKSIWISAILEEGGVFGFLLFLWFVIGVVVGLFRRRAYIGLSCFVVMMVLNLGEFSIFSLSLLGGIEWFLVLLGLVLDAKRQAMMQYRVRGFYYPMRGV